MSFWGKLAQTTGVSVVLKFALFDFLCYQRLQKRHEQDNFLGTDKSFDASAN